MLSKFEHDALEQDESFEDNDEDEEGDDLAGRLGGVDLDSISSTDLWSLLSPAERDSFLKAVRNPRSASAQELLQAVDVQSDVILPWWEAPEALTNEEPVEDASKSKKYGKRPVVAQLPVSLLRRPQGPDAGPPLLYNICAVLTAYAYVTRHFGASPLCSLREDSASARQLMRALVPSLADRHSRVLFDSMDAVVTDLWPRLVGTEKAERASFVLFLRDAAQLLAPRRVAVLDSDHDLDIETSPHRNTLAALSDLIAFFQSQTSAKGTPLTAKLQFYAAHIAALPAPLLAGFSAEVAARARHVEAEAEGDAAIGTVSASSRENSESTTTDAAQIAKSRPVIEEL
ncbi:hypothetical protein DFH11DRAFT_1506044 [Phellopilus nigrolimitatus]|nr:hypothetical protein DFH11DRAFT_1506044 [Phellopilus nigrolimitatus]